MIAHLGRSNKIMYTNSFRVEKGASLYGDKNLTDFLLHKKPGIP